VVSYSDILARNHANDFRRVVNDPLYRATFPTMCLDRDTDREIATTKRGKRIATSVDGTLTGLGGNLIIIDDTLKLGDAMSEAVRARVIEWYRSTLLSRGDDKTTTRIVVVMQRVHQNDLVGYLQPLDRPVPMVATDNVGRTAATLLQANWVGHHVVELEATARVSPNLIAAAFGKALNRTVKAEIVPRADWERIFRAQGMKNPMPRMQMVDGFNEGWIDFREQGAQSRKGVTGIDEVVCALVSKSGSDS